MTKSVNHPSRAKTIERGKEAGRGGRVAVKSDQPAQEIAEDEVEIAKTGSKPAEDSRPMTRAKP